MAQTVEQALAQAVLHTDDVDYRLVKLPPTAVTAAAGVLAEIGEPFAALIVDKDEVTLVLPTDALAEFDRRLPGRVVSASEYRLITLDAELEPTLVGLMARISAALAEAGIPIFPFAAFSRDHLLVPADHVEAAMDALRRLQAGARQ